MAAAVLLVLMQMIRIALSKIALPALGVNATGGVIPRKKMIVVRTANLLPEQDEAGCTENNGST